MLRQNGLIQWYRIHLNIIEQICFQSNHTFLIVHHCLHRLIQWHIYYSGYYYLLRNPNYCLFPSHSIVEAELVKLFIYKFCHISTSPFCEVHGTCRVEMNQEYHCATFIVTFTWKQSNCVNLENLSITFVRQFNPLSRQICIVFSFESSLKR